MRIAALDLGSNTSLLLIADVAGDRIARVLHDETRVNKMGQGVHAERRFHPEALKRLDECFADYAATIKKSGVDKVAAVATSAARDVSNGQALLDLGHRHGIPIHIISGEFEARLTFKGAICDRPRAGVAVIDVGGGSTELIREIDGKPRGVSVDVGSVRLSEAFVTKHPVAKAELDEIHDYSREAFARAHLPKGGFNELVAVAGTPTTLAALEQKTPFDERKVHGFTLTRAMIENWIDKLSGMTVEERERLAGMQPKRADVIVAGAIILLEGMQALGQERMTVSTRGVRYGVALSWQEL